MRRTSRQDGKRGEHGPRDSHARGVRQATAMRYHGVTLDALTDAWLLEIRLQPFLRVMRIAGLSYEGLVTVTGIVLTLTDFRLGREC